MSAILLRSPLFAVEIFVYCKSVAQLSVPLFQLLSPKTPHYAEETSWNLTRNMSYVTSVVRYFRSRILAPPWRRYPMFLCNGALHHSASGPTPCCLLKKCAQAERRTGLRALLRFFDACEMHLCQAYILYTSTAD